MWVKDNDGGSRENQRQIIQHVLFNNKLMSNNPMQNPLIKLNDRKFRSTPETAEVVNFRNRAKLWCHQINQKESDHIWKACPEAWTLSCCIAVSWSVSGSKLKKEISTADNRKWSPVLRPVVQPANKVKGERRRRLCGQLFNTSTFDRVRSEKCLAVPLYLDELAK